MQSHLSHGPAWPWRWGLVRRHACRRLAIKETSPHQSSMTAIYDALKQAGFAETFWQFVYPGQIGGLIKAPQNSLIELHVRFFEDGLIYCELELGRSVLLHFLNHRFFANGYLIRKIGSKLTPVHLDYLKWTTERYKSLYGSRWPEWTATNRFITRRIKMQIRFLTLLSDWRSLAGIMLLSVAASATKSSIVLPAVTAAMILIYLVAPRRRQ